MQKTPPMHLNTSPTCFEGSGTGKQEKRHKTLKNLKLAPQKQLGVGKKRPAVSARQECNAKAWQRWEIHRCCSTGSQKKHIGVL